MTSPDDTAVVAFLAIVGVVTFGRRGWWRGLALGALAYALMWAVAFDGSLAYEQRWEPTLMDWGTAVAARLQWDTWWYALSLVGWALAGAGVSVWEERWKAGSRADG